MLPPSLPDRPRREDATDVRKDSWVTVEHVFGKQFYCTGWSLFPFCLETQVTVTAEWHSHAPGHGETVDRESLFHRGGRALKISCQPRI